MARCGFPVTGLAELDAIDMDQFCREQLEFANKLIFVKKYNEADRVLRDLLATGAGVEESLIHLRRIELKSLLGELEEVKQHYIKNAAAQDDDGLSKTCVVLAEMFANPSDSQDFQGRLNEILQDFGASPLLYFAMGYAAERQGNNDRAKYYYEHSIAMDQQWYPSIFGLSQVYFNLGDDVKGDQYFHQFELMAPYNVYGTFDTHRRLSQEFVELNRFDDAELAIQALTTWWQDNKGFAPPEIQIFEMLATSKISEKKGDRSAASHRRFSAQAMTNQMLTAMNVDENAMYFVARILTEFGEDSLSLQAYKKLISLAGTNPQIVQKVGNHFLTGGDYVSALDLFTYAYDKHPNNPEIRFCLLIARLKNAGVSAEEYLIGRERIRQLADSGDKVEFLSLLTALLARFQDDWDVHFHLAELFAKMGHEKKAALHYGRMYELDPKGQNSRLRYANFLMNHGEIDRAFEILSSIEFHVGSMNEVEAEIQWLKASYYDRKQDWAASMDMLEPLIARDPWNINYLIHQVLCLTGKKDGTQAVNSAQDHWARKLMNNEEKRVNWLEFHKDTEKLSEEHAYTLAYARAKLQFLYMRGNEHSLRSVVREACRNDASKGARELLRLLNTNFDHPAVYWGLGLLYKELWQLEVASMWFELGLDLPVLEDSLKALIYVDLADCYIWRNVNLPKSVEYIKLSLDLSAKSGQQDRRAMMIMGHGLLRQGQVRQAQAYLDQMRDISGQFEVQYLVGLVQYRNGHPLKANEVWKPLLKYKTEQMRDYRIKQEILKYYFEKTPYAPKDLSKAN